MIAAAILRLFGWRIEGTLPPVPKAVLVLAPHTSNWDFVLLVLVKHALRVDTRFIGKHTLFHGPLGWWLRRLGGMPVDRAAPGDIVDQVVAELRAAEHMWFALAPEGTRKRGQGWKTGFYRIACQAQVPIIPIVIDAGRRELRIALHFVPSGDEARDFDRLREVYAGARGFRPESAAPVHPD